MNQKDTKVTAQSSRAFTSHSIAADADLLQHRLTGVYACYHFEEGKAAGLGRALATAMVPKYEIDYQ